MERKHFSRRSVVHCTPDGGYHKEITSEVRRKSHEDAEALCVELQKGKVKLSLSSFTELKPIYEVRKRAENRTNASPFKTVLNKRTFTLSVCGKVIDTIKTASERQIESLIEKGYKEVAL